MQAIRYRITALSPLLFFSNTGDPNMVATLDYIPGTNLRGMFANGYIRARNLTKSAHRDETFYRWFLKGELIITNAYIVDEKGNRTYPIPLSIQKEKRGETIYDLLLQDEDFDTPKKGIEGYGIIAGSSLKRVPVKKSLNFHHERDRERGVSKEGRIFNYESIDPGQSFEGWVIGSGDDLTKFKEIMKDGIYYLGRSRNSQYGKVEFRIISEPEEFKSEIETEEDSSSEAVLTLLSDTIIYNEHGFSTVSKDVFEKAIGCKIKKAFIRMADEEGFISVWRMKTPSERCFKAGSCFLLELKDGDRERLLELQKTGIGIKTHEGFGRFVIGWQKESKLNKEAEEEKKINKPSDTPPESVKTLVKDIIKDVLVRHFQLEAIKKVDEFRNYPPASLLAKLEEKAKTGTLKEFLDEGSGQMKKTARDNLEKCRTTNQTLLDFLRGFDAGKELDKALKSTDLSKLCEEISYPPMTDEELKKELEREYLVTLLSVMRKKKKKEDK